MNGLTENKKYSMEFLKLSDLIVDRYQSQINYIRVKRIITNFDEEELQPIDVSYRDGKYYIVDGQHRVEACKQRKMLNILCKVHYGLAYEQEANLYYQLNNPENRRTPTANQRFKALLEAKDPIALSIKYIVENNGFILGLDNGKAINKIICTATLTKIYKSIGSVGLDRVLRLSKTTWDCILEAVDKNIFMGIYYFTKTYGNEFWDGEFAKSLSKIQPKTIISEGRSSILSPQAYVAYAEAILKHYNKGRRNQLQNKL